MRTISRRGAEAQSSPKARVARALRRAGDPVNGVAGPPFNRYRLVPPSPALKARVVAATQAAWKTTEAEKPATPFLDPALVRFAASIAATIVLVCGANHLDRFMLGRWQQPAQEQPTAASQFANLDPVLRDNPNFVRMAQMTQMAAAHTSAPTDEQIIRHRVLMRVLLRAPEADRTDDQERVIGFPQSQWQRKCTELDCV